MKVKPAKHSGEVILEVNRRDEPLLTAAAASPFRLKNILVPIDFSDCSKKALQYAIPLAKQYDAAITLLYVLPRAPYMGGEYGAIDYPSFENEMIENAEKELSKFVVDEVQGAVRNEAFVRTGSPAAEIVEMARSQPSDLIVVSTHGRSGLKHVLLGSVAEHVVRSAPCPVLVVRENEHEFLAG
jgi:nucleotide-binding universal stress UspA family protein